jgi:hypothetical protein
VTTTISSQGEWTASALRLVAHWATVCDADGRTRLEMSWSVPTVDVPAVAQAERRTSTAV